MQCTCPVLKIGHVAVKSEFPDIDTLLGHVSVLVAMKHNIMVTRIYTSKRLNGTTQTKCFELQNGDRVLAVKIGEMKSKDVTLIKEMTWYSSSNAPKPINRRDLQINEKRKCKKSTTDLTTRSLVSDELPEKRSKTSVAEETVECRICGDAARWRLGCKCRAFFCHECVKNQTYRRSGTKFHLEKTENRYIYIFLNLKQGALSCPFCTTEYTDMRDLAVSGEDGEPVMEPAPRAVGWIGNRPERTLDSFLKNADIARRTILPYYARQQELRDRNVALERYRDEAEKRLKECQERMPDCVLIPRLKEDLEKFTQQRADVLAGFQEVDEKLAAEWVDSNEIDIPIPEETIKFADELCKNNAFAQPQCGPAYDFKKYNGWDGKFGKVYAEDVPPPTDQSDEE